MMSNADLVLKDGGSRERRRAGRWAIVLNILYFIVLPAVIVTIGQFNGLGG